jgi:hypothetical protein
MDQASRDLIKGPNRIHPGQQLRIPESGKTMRAAGGAMLGGILLARRRRSANKSTTTVHSLDRSAGGPWWVGSCRAAVTITSLST